MSRLRYTIARPFNYSDYGVYSYAGATGIMAAGISAASEVFQFRFDSTNASLLAAVRRVKISAAITTTFFAAGVPLMFELVKATAWTAVGTGGGGITQAALCKRRTSMASTGMTALDMRIATTAALGAGTKTLETYAQGIIVCGGPVTASLDGTAIHGQYLLDADVGAGDHPLVLVDQEGFVIRVTAPATGTWTAGIQCEWAETTSYPYGT
jgi:hypothetical protein